MTRCQGKGSRGFPRTSDRDAHAGLGQLNQPQPFTILTVPIVNQLVSESRMRAPGGT